MTTVPEGIRALTELRRTLVDPDDDLRRGYSAAVLSQAVTRAAGRPSPQAAMSAAALEATSEGIIGPAGTQVSSTALLGDVLFGSEFGSGIYRQFGPRSSRGLWLFPTVEDPGDKALDVAEDWLGDVLERVT